MMNFNNLTQIALIAVALTSCTPARSTDKATRRQDPSAFERAPRPPAEYDIALLPSDFAGLSEFNYPGAPAPTISPEPPVTDPKNLLQTLDVLSVGISVEMLRQGEVWREVMKVREFYGSVLPPPDSKRYLHSDDPGVFWKRQHDVLELALKPMIEAWPIPTLTIYDSLKEEASERLKDIFWNSVDNMRMGSGLHWSQIRQVNVLYSDTPENLVEPIFRTFERYPDLPAMLVYVKGPGGRYEDGKRVHGAPVATYAAMVVARRERVEWLRPWAPYTQMGQDTIYPGFWRWAQQPPRPFKPTPFLPTPWTKGHFEQWDSLPTLAQLHRPVVASLATKEGEDLRRKDRESAKRAAMVAAWRASTQQAIPTRVFFDTGKSGTGVAALSTMLRTSESDIDLIDPKEGIDLSARLGDMEAASPFAGLVLATMATAESGTPSMVIPMRREDQATFMLITPAKKKANKDAFDVNLLPQLSVGDDMPREAPSDPEENYVRKYYNDPREVAESKRIIDEFLNSVPPGDEGA